MRSTPTGPSDALAGASQPEEGLRDRRPLWYSTRLERWCAVATACGVVLPHAVAQYATGRRLPVRTSGAYEDLRWSPLGLQQTGSQCPADLASLADDAAALLRAAIEVALHHELAYELLRRSAEGALAALALHEAGRRLLDEALRRARPLRVGELAILAGLGCGAGHAERVMAAPVPSGVQSAVRYYAMAVETVFRETSGAQRHGLVDRLEAVLPAAGRSEPNRFAKTLLHCLQSAREVARGDGASARIGSLLSRLASEARVTGPGAVYVAMGLSLAAVDPICCLNAVHGLRAAGPMTECALVHAQRALLDAHRALGADEGEAACAVRALMKSIAREPNVGADAWLGLADALVDQVDKLGDHELEVGLELARELRTLHARWVVGEGVELAVTQMLVQVLRRVHAQAYARDPRCADELRQEIAAMTRAEEGEMACESGPRIARFRVIAPWRRAVRRRPLVAYGS